MRVELDSAGVPDEHVFAAAQVVEEWGMALGAYQARVRTYFQSRIPGAMRKGEHESEA